jgi:hypothetical protein
VPELVRDDVPESCRLGCAAEFFAQGILGPAAAVVGEQELGRPPVSRMAHRAAGRSANELRAAQVESYLDVAREQGFNAVLTISNQLAGAPGEHPLTVDKRKLKKVSLHHLSWSQIRTEALVEQGNKAVSDPDQAWILAEFIRYLEHPRSGAVEFEDMGASWVAVREAVKAGTLQSGLLREHWAGGLAPAGASGPVQRSCDPVRSRRAAWSGRLRQRREPLCIRSG